MIRKYLTNHKSVSWALIDQAMVSGVNFLTGLLLARFLGFEVFGKFTLLWMTVLFANSIQYSMISAPMMSIGPKISHDERKGYYKSVIYQQFIFSILTFLFLYLGLYIANIINPQWKIANLIFPLALAGSLFQLQDFIRRYFFSLNNAKKAFYNDFISYMGQLVVLVTFYVMGFFSLTIVLFIIAMTSAVAVIIALLIELDGRSSFTDIISTFKRHWDFSKWSSLNALLQWASANLVMIIAGSFLGNTSVGVLKAAQNVMAILHILFQALENFVPMKASSLYVNNGIEAMKHYINRVTFIGGSLTVVLGLFVTLYSQELFILIYGDKYADMSYVLIWYAIIYVFMFLGFPYRIALRTLENTKAIFKSQLLSSVFTLVFAYPLINLYGLNGALASLLIIYIAVFFILYIFLQRDYCKLSSHELEIRK